MTTRLGVVAARASSSGSIVSHDITVFEAQAGRPRLRRRPARATQSRAARISRQIRRILSLVQPAGTSHPFRCKRPSEIPAISCTRFRGLLVRLIRRKSISSQRQREQDFPRGVLCYWMWAGLLILAFPACAQEALNPFSRAVDPIEQGKIDAANDPAESVNRRDLQRQTNFSTTTS